MGKLIKIIILSFIVLSCSQPAKKVESRKETPAILLLSKLNKLNDKGVLFGHQDDLAYGIGWRYDGGAYLQSDVKKATGSYPAILGWDIGHIGDSLNIDKVPFDHIKKLIVKGDSIGAINTISWHPSFLNDSINSWFKEIDMVNTLIPGGENHQELIYKLDLFSAFLRGLKRTDGSLVPIIFRPWHEMNGNWFWWGEDFCDNEQYKKLFQFTVNYLRNEKGLNNLLIAYSPDRQFHSEEEYLKWYPGDAYVDIMAMDNYYDFQPGGEGLDAAVNKLEIVANVAEKKSKLAAFTETGFDKLEHQNWYSQELLPILKQKELIKKISYVMVWRNHDTTHFYVPYKGHPSLPDFLKFKNDEQILLLDDIN
ncbi:mannan endo-1,4-beta-mannosidase [Lutibacter agarilyticus]|uniref:Mannan endo-1,4-beta-mannosidase n=1 Tax=Lutibacter agarilyticus TaxID=1109740 RepID=A0A238WXI2_9FLAO|nr:glycosyl hydrolase [Lutibacter agarilyticus]SNR51355.1 mannan endo-1,4-beta-mannosidase [Lutibacter agarilyticus]